MLFELLLQISSVQQDFKMINTALKLNDILFDRAMISKEQVVRNLDRSKKLMDDFFNSSQRQCER
jgi:hypothetical protein